MIASVPGSRSVDRFEALIVGAIVGAVPPLAGLLALWWGSIPFVPERWIPGFAAAGLLAGITADVIWLKRWTRRALSLHWLLWMAVYVFYSVGMFGLFMGVPVFNLALALPAGLVVGCRLAREQVGSEEMRRASKAAALFTTAVLAVACAASAALAWTDPYTAANLEGMLGLSFEVTRPMIAALIVAGGAALLAMQWLLTTWIARLAYAWLRRPPKAVSR